ncbi:MAG: SPASM domain-containing protein [Acidobacteria bacterium]|nr:SPASM domain-containing protein [Acidobacteriota bacterium]
MRVVQAFRMLARHGVSCDVLCVVHRGNVHQPASVYRFFKEIGVKFLQFLPLVRRRAGGGVSEETVPPEDYGGFLCAVFDEWVRHDLRDIVIQNFDEALRPFVGMEHAVCVFREKCGDVVVVEHNGDFYCCDHFVEPAHRLGNIRETPLLELLESRVLENFGRLKLEALPGYCRKCEVLALCNGGCPKDRFVRTPDGEEGLNYLCPGFKRFFLSRLPYLSRMGELARAGQTVDRLMDELRCQSAAAGHRSGRNDPCPCGSGRKYKKCCAGKTS